LDVDVNDFSADWCLNFGFHFHGFGDEDGLTSFDGVAFFDEDVYYVAGHGCGDVSFVFGLLASGLIFVGDVFV